MGGRQAHRARPACLGRGDLTSGANVGQAHKADQILKQAFPQVDPQTELVLVQSPSKTIQDPAFRATVKDVENTIAGNPAIKNAVACSWKSADR